MTITLDEAATKLGLFYTELMDVLDEDGFAFELVDPKSGHVEPIFPSEIDPSPDTVIEYEIFVQIQEHLKIEVLPERDPLKVFNAAHYERLQKYRQRLEKWTDDWHTKNKLVYESLLHTREGYFKRRGLIVPTSFEEMHLWLQVHYANSAGSRPEFYLTKDFNEKYFLLYHEYAKKVFTADRRVKEITNEHWALFYTYVTSARYHPVGKNQRKSCVEFFEGMGMKGNDIYGKQVRSANPAGRREVVRVMGRPFMEVVKNMLTKYKYPKAVKLVKKDIKEVIVKS